MMHQKGFLLKMLFSRVVVHFSLCTFTHSDFQLLFPPNKAVLSFHTDDSLNASSRAPAAVHLTRLGQKINLTLLLTLNYPTLQLNINISTRQFTPSVQLGEKWRSRIPRNDQKKNFAVSCKSRWGVSCPPLGSCLCVFCCVTAQHEMC